MAGFFVASDQVSEDVIRMTGQDVHHIRHVLRKEEGDRITVTSGDSTVYTCRIRAFDGDTLLLDILSSEQGKTELSARITLFQGLPKGDKLETVIQKAVELGADEVIPVAMKRCVVKVDAKKASGKIARYQAIAESAAKQSGRSRVPKVRTFMTVPEAITYMKREGFTKLLVPYECAEGMEESRKVIESVMPGDRVGIVIGPEGGFEQAEIEQLREAGGCVFSLGRRILRTETAGMTVLSLLMFRLECLEDA